MLFKVEDVNHIYDIGSEVQTYALTDINLSIANNRLIGIMGPSGSRKSSLLYALSALKKPTSGKVILNSARDVSYKMLSINDVLFTVLTIFVIFVLSVSMSNLSYISFMNRESEFYILAAIGYNRSFLLKKLGKENALVYIAGYICGTSLSILFAYLLNLSIFEPQGKAMPLLSATGILTALAIPVIVGIVSLFPAAAQLRKRDTVEVIGSTV